MIRRKGEDNRAAKAVSRARRDLIAGAFLIAALALMVSSGWRYVASVERMLGATSHAADLAAGDRLLITDTGSYDHSMAYNFARGGGRHRTLSD